MEKKFGMKGVEVGCRLLISLIWEILSVNCGYSLRSCFNRHLYITAFSATWCR